MLVAAVELAAAFGVAGPDPVGGAVAGAGEPVGVDEGFEQDGGISVAAAPVGGQLAGGAGPARPGDWLEAHADLQHGASPLLAAILSMKNTFDWLSGDSDLLAASAKLFSEPGLVYGGVSAPKFDENASDDDLKKQDEDMREARKTTQREVGITLTLLAPLLIVAYGLLRWRMRTNARLNVQLA